MARKGKSKMTMEEGGLGVGMYSCCLSSCGLIHFIGGVGVAFLLVEYFGLTGLMTWGWILVIVAVLGHLMGKSKMCRC